MQPFSIVLADPPWFYNSRAHHSKTRFGGGVHDQYPLMKLKDIKALPVSEIIAKDAILFLWTTWPHLESGLQVIKSWGFQYKTLGFDWMKTNAKNHTKLKFGVGFYAKSNSEPCLLATRGQTIKPASNYVSSAVLTPISKHSEKPAEVYNRIEVLYPTQNKIELFARKTRAGWLGLGNEITGNDIKEDLYSIIAQIDVLSSTPKLFNTTDYLDADLVSK